jgi:putative radical SAM enzyme (TIGR03279 family)
MHADAVPGGVVAWVDPAGALHELMPGDVVTTVDDRPVRDVIDWQWLTAEPEFTVGYIRAGVAGELHVRRTAGKLTGIGFSEVLFTPVRQCENACSFCFISGLPPGLRPALYVRDDDYRLSFLSGNFVTLTNVAEDDIDRILEQHLSPLRVSVHAVDPAVRERLLCPTVDDRTLEVLDRLLGAGIKVHVQIVLVQGVNDGTVLDETLGYLAARPGVRSVGIVPMGYTSHQRRWSHSFDADGAAYLIAQVSGVQSDLRAVRGVRWAYAADEFYLTAGVNLPPYESYDDFPQYENGIGIAATFRHELSPAPAGTPPTATVVTGVLAAPFLREALSRQGWDTVRVLAVPNRLFGGNVSVAGLLGGRDIASAIADDGGRGRYLVPDVVVNSDGLLLDDVPARELGRLSGADVQVIGSTASDLVGALRDPEGRRTP